jgi:hypothetical protein
VSRGDNFAVRTLLFIARIEEEVVGLAEAGFRCDAGIRSAHA